MAKYVFYVIVAYMMYKLIFDFIVPIFLTSRKIRQQFNQAREQMDNQNNQKDHPSAEEKTHVNSTGVSSKIGEYIDFEEIRK